MLEAAGKVERTSAAEKGQDAVNLDVLRLEIEQHRKQEESRSYLEKAVGTVRRLFYNGDDNSLAKSEALYAQAQQKQKAGDAAGLAALKGQIGDRLKAEREAFQLGADIDHYASGFLKTAALFARGKIGLAGTVALYALDQARPGDGIRAQLADGSLGALKGGLVKGSLHLLSNDKVGIAARGVGLGLSSRALEVGLSRQTYLDPSTGKLSLAKGFDRTARDALNSKSLLADALIFGTAHGLFGVSDRLAGGAIKRNPLLATVFTGGTFGLSAGAGGEIMRQEHAGEQFDLGKVIKRSLIQGGIDALGAGPGGMQARAHLTAARRLAARPDVHPDRSGSGANIERALRTASQTGGESRSRAADRIASPSSAEKTGLVVGEKGAGEQIHLAYLLAFKPAKPETFEALSSRLSEQPSRKETLLNLVERGVGRNTRFAIVDAEQPVRVYRLNGSALEFLVPEHYAARLEEVRELRKTIAGGGEAAREAEAKLKEHRYGYRVLPEDLIPYVEQLPARSIVKRIFLLNEPNPEDVFHKLKYGEDFRSSASFSADGSMKFFEATIDPFDPAGAGAHALLRDMTFHEWAHGLKSQAGYDSALFDLATHIEKGGYFADKHARRTVGENWAVHLGEIVLHPDPDVFFRFVHDAPVRSVFLGRALSRALAGVPASERSVHHDVFAERVRYIEERVLPQAQKVLIEHMNSPNGEYKRAALKLLLEIGNDRQISQLPAVDTVDFSYSWVSPTAVRRIALLKGLKTLDFTGTGLSTQDISALRSTFPHLNLKL